MTRLDFVSMPRPRSPSRSKPRRRPAAAAPRALKYRVVELSNVDEGALEATVNEWVAQGWTFDGVQFAMRESSKRPAMAFVFFTRAGAAAAVEEPFREPATAEQHLRRLASGRQDSGRPPSGDAWARLVELARDGEES